MRHAFATMAILLASLAAGCASTKQARLQEAIRKAAHGKPVAETRGDVAVIFRELAQSGGVDPQSLYVAVQKSETLNAAAVGHHHFLVTRGALGLDDRCFLTGLVAHELAHDILEHPEMAAKTSDVTSTVSTVLGVAASAVVPGAGYLVIQSQPGSRSGRAGDQDSARRWKAGVVAPVCARTAEGPVGQRRRMAEHAPGYRGSDRGTAADGRGHGASSMRLGAGRSACVVSWRAGSL
jgi:hypothetical protein